MQLAALLHDVDDAKLSPETYASKRKAVDFMKGNGVDNEIIETVCKIIEEVSFAGNDSVVPSTINACRMRTGWMQSEQLELQEHLLMVVVKVERFMIRR